MCIGESIKKIILKGEPILLEPVVEAEIESFKDINQVLI